MTSNTIEVQELRLATPIGELFAKRWLPRDPSAARHPPIILLHDSLGSVELWRDVPERLALATGRCVVAYDRLGFGRSAPHPGQVSLDFIRDEAQSGFRHVKDALGIDRFVVFGHSVGGGMAVGVAAAWQEACDAVVTVSAQAFVEDRTVAGIRAAQSAFADAAQVDRLRRYHGDKAPWVLGAWIDRWLDPAFAAWTLDAELVRMGCPNLVLHGERDEYGSVRHPERIAALSAGASTVHIGAWGHVPHREQPEDVVGLVAAWLGS